MPKWQKWLLIVMYSLIGVSFAMSAGAIWSLWPRTLYLDDEAVMSLLIKDIEDSCVEPARFVFAVCDRVDFREDSRFQQAVKKAKESGLTVNFALVSTKEEEIALARAARVLGVDAKKASGFWTSGALVCGSQSVNGHRKLRHRPWSQLAATVRGTAVEADKTNPFSLLFLPAILPSL